MKAMILWTGGVESTALLFWALKSTDWDVCAHHVHIDNPEERDGKEAEAIAALLPRLQTLRPFSYSTSHVDVCNGRATAMDAELVYPIGRAAMRHKGAERLLRGWCAEDEWARSEGREPQPWPGPGTRFEHIARECLGSDAATLAPWLPLYATSKAQQWDSLGNWARLTWSCRRPVEGNACGVCHACKERRAAIRGTSNIADVQRACHGD